MDLKYPKDYRILSEPIKIRFKGVFDFYAVYKFIHSWLRSRKMEYKETRYKDKLDTAFGNEIEIDVEGEKKATEYLQYKIFVNYHLWESRDVMVTIGGKQVRRTQGRLEIKLQAYIITDWQGKYSTGKLTHKLMHKFLNDVLLKKEIDLLHVDVVERDMHVFSAEIKKRLGMESV
jgi:hypothetical protein